MIEEKKKSHVSKPRQVANDDGKVIDLMAAPREQDQIEKRPRVR